MALFPCKNSSGNEYLQIVTPQMGDYTIPSGTAFASAYTGYFEPWRAFNRSELRGWLSHNSGTWLYAGNYVGYTFPEDIEIISADILFKRYDSGSSYVSGKFQVYNNTDWVDISSVFTLYTSSVYTNKELTNLGAYKQYRWIATSNASTSSSYGIKLSFNGKVKIDPNKQYVLV